MPTDNRRRTSRHVTCVPAGVHTSEKDRVGLIRDASTVGALLFSKSQFKVDDKVTLTIRIESDEQSDVEVHGRILRIERQSADEFWNFRIAVVFDPPRDDLAPLFKLLADRQARLFGSGPG